MRSRSAIAAVDGARAGVRVHPGAWLCWAAAATVVTLTTTDPFYLVALIVVCCAVAGSRRIEGPWGRSMRVFLGAAAVAVAARTALVLLGPRDPGSVAAAALEGLRVATLLMVYGAFNCVTDPFALLRVVPRRLHEAALAASLALSLTPRLIEAGARVREAQRLRGIDTGRLRSATALVVPVLATGMDRAVTLAESMDARGHGGRRRTRYRTQPWGAGSWLVTGCAAAAAGIFVTAALGADPSLGMQTSPPAWPPVSGRDVAALLILGLPALLPGGGR